MLHIKFVTITVSSETFIWHKFGRKFEDFKTGNIGGSSLRWLLGTTSFAVSKNQQADY